MQTAIGYVRVSTEGQAKEGVSLEAQQRKIEAWCVANDFELGGVFVDAGISGKRADNRPELQNALSAVTKAKAVLVVYSLSRLARSTKDTIQISERLDKAGADLVSLSEKLDTTSAAGKMVFRMMAVLAEFERDQISERTCSAMAHKKSKGERVGTIPFGFKSESPRDAKALGRKVQNVHADEWGAECFEIVVSGSDWASIRIRDQFREFPIGSLLLRTARPD